MIKIETHCHTGGSNCADTLPELIAKRYYDDNYNAVVITNHISPSSYESWEGETHFKKIGSYLSIYENSKNAFNKYGIKTYFAAEIAVNSPEGHAEYAILDFDEKFLYDNKPLFTLTQKELFYLCEDNGIFMWKVHPFRMGEFAGNPLFMHGAECFNGHYHHQNNNALAEKFCEENRLIKLSGTDFHHADQPITAGILVDELCKDESELKKLFLSGNYEIIAKKDEYENAYKRVIEQRRK